MLFLGYRYFAKCEIFLIICGSNTKLQWLSQTYERNVKLKLSFSYEFNKIYEFNISMNFIRDHNL